ncbi:MAG: Ig-like domain-containing protein [Verrucomicrobiales bacterium]
MTSLRALYLLMVLGAIAAAGSLAQAGGVLLLDTKNNGFDLRAYVATSLTGPSYRKIHWTWEASDDAFLILDVAGSQTLGFQIRNESGQNMGGHVLIRSGLTTVNKSGQLTKAATAWQLLGIFDSNADAKITSVDTIWPHLRLFFDDDGDGVMEPSEIRDIATYFKTLNIGQLGADMLDAEGNLRQDGNYVTPAGFPRIISEVTLAEAPLQPDPLNGPWEANHVVLFGTAEAEMMARAGDVDNFGFGWRPGFNPFEGKQALAHGFPWLPQPGDAEGTDRIMVVSSFQDDPPNGKDAYIRENLPPGSVVRPITLLFDVSHIEVTNAVLQMFLDDFQAPVWSAEYTVTINGKRAPFLEKIINKLQQAGQVGKMLTVNIPSAFLDEVDKGRLELIIDDHTTGAGEAYAIDFIKLLVNSKTFAHAAIMEGLVTDATDKPISGAIIHINGTEIVSSESGGFTLTNVPAGMILVEAVKPGYQPENIWMDVEAGNVAQLPITLRSVPSANLQVDTTVDSANPIVGGVFNYRLQLRNLGPDKATAISATNYLPAEVTYLNAVNASGDINRDGNMVVFQIPTLEANTTAEMTITVRAASAGLLIHVATAAAAEFDPFMGNNSITIETLVFPGLNQLPQVELVNLQEGQVVDSCAPLALAATASDPDGSISKVEFLYGSVKIGEALAAPFAVAWTNPINGVHALTAVATDNMGAKKTSLPVIVRVEGPALHSIEEVQSIAGPFSFCFGVVPGRMYEVQGSADLKVWMPVTQFTAMGSSHSFKETSITPVEPKWKFFRAVQLK